jgi:zinc transport system substrate-binding protein
MKNVLMMAACMFALAAFSGCVSQGAQANESAKLKVVASFYPLYDFAKNVGGDRADVSILIPAGVEPHNFEPAPSDIMLLSEADIFILNGAGLEHWAPNLIEGVGNRKLLVVDTSDGIALLNSQDLDVSGSDPHIWLDPLYASKQVEAIKNAFIEADPAGRAHYEANAAAYEAKLGALDAEFRALLPSCRKKDILITHATLAYFCQEYGCRQIPIEGVSEEGEPSPAELATIVDQARERNVTTVYFESMISPRSAQAIAGEINGKVLVFNSVHGITADEEAQGKDYLSLMKENLQAISEGLDCG